MLFKHPKSSESEYLLITTWPGKEPSTYGMRLSFGADGEGTMRAIRAIELLATTIGCILNDQASGEKIDGIIGAIVEHIWENATDAPSRVPLLAADDIEIFGHDDGDDVGTNDGGGFL